MTTVRQLCNVLVPFLGIPNLTSFAAPLVRAGWLPRAGEKVDTIDAAVLLAGVLAAPAPVVVVDALHTLKEARLDSGYLSPGEPMSFYEPERPMTGPLGIECRSQISLIERFTKGAEHLRMNHPRVLPAHFHLGRMHVYVHQLRIDRQEQKDDREPIVFHQPPIGFFDRMLQEAIADVAAVEEGVLPVTRRA